MEPWLNYHRLFYFWSVVREGGVSAASRKLGCHEGDVMEWRTQQGLRRLRVDAVIYQPEAQGDFFA